MEINFLNILTYFLLYSFLGWILESIFKSILLKKPVNSGFLNGPFCPIYGIGAIIMYLFLQGFKGNIILLFFVSFFILSIWEYIVGFLLEKIFRTKYWDYSDHKINIHGRVCLTNSIFWGILGILFINYINPFVEQKMSLIDNEIILCIDMILSLGIIIDCVISIISIVEIDSALKYIDELNHEIKSKLEEINIISKTIDKSKESMQLIIDELNKKRERFIKKLYRRIYRLKNAFPTMKSEKITEILNHKLYIKKRKNERSKEKN